MTITGFFDGSKLHPLDHSANKIKNTGLKPDKISAHSLVMPGIIDISARASEFEIESQAAQHSGISHLCIEPDSYDPIVDTAEIVEGKFKTARHGPVLFPLGAITQGLMGEQLAEIATLKESGCIALTDAGYTWPDYRVLKRAMEYAKSFNIPLHLTPKDHALSKAGCAHNGPVAYRLGLPTIPSSAESGCLAMMLELVAETGARVHFCRLSCARSVELIRQAKKTLPVSADVAIHHLVLNQTAIDHFNTLCHLDPPLRTEDDRLSLLEGINDTTIDAICSQHQPRSQDEKLAPFPSSKTGISSLEILLPLTLFLIQREQLKPTAALAALTTGPAHILGITNNCYIAIDTNHTFQLDAKRLKSAGENCPYHGWTLTGKLTAANF